MQNVLNKPVLLLNMTYEPIGVINVKRAVSLQFRDKVYIEEESDRYKVSSKTQSLNIPSVIRLKTYRNINKSKTDSSNKRHKIYMRDKFRCSYCNVRYAKEHLTLDHIIPKGQGGSNENHNLVSSCLPCNQRKGNRTPEEANMKLLHTPTKLKFGLEKHTLHYYSDSNPNWKKYLFLEHNNLVNVQ